MNKEIKTQKSIAHKVRSAETRVVRVKTEGLGLGALKTAIVLALIFSQLALMIYLYIEIALAFRWYMIVSLILSGLTCLYVLSSSKNSLSKAVWIIFLLVGFGFGYIIYIMSDERIFFSRAKKRYKRIFEASEKYIPAPLSLEGESPEVKNDVNYLRRVGNFASYRNTSLEYFPSGAELFDDALEACSRAESFIFMEFFIMADGALMNRFCDIIEERRKRGVSVRIIIDDMGSHKTLSGKMKKRLRDMGVELLFFNRLVPIFSVGLNYRDHRKIIVIDGKLAYTGGSNFADEYINEKRMYGYWKDTGLKLRGEAIDALTLMFLRQWQYLSEREEDYSPYFGHCEPIESPSIVTPFVDGLDYAFSVGKNAYENIISSADERLYIMTPYFICDDTMTNLIKNKALSGVDVRIIIPGVPDKAFVYGVSRNNAEKLTEFGVRVYTMNDAFVHSKLVLTENAVIVGSINMDLRSFYQQYESAVYTNDRGTMEAVLGDFEESFPECSEINDKNKKRKNIFHRISAGVLQLFAPFM